MKIDKSINNISFDDILIVPKKSKIDSRANIDIQSKLGNPNNPAAWIHLNIPVMIAPMDYISTTAMIENIVKVGGVAFIQRWQPLEKRLNQLQELTKKDIPISNIGFALSTSESEDKNFIDKILSFGIKILLIDTAFGHTDLCINSVKKLRSLIPNNVHIMAGNISSYEAYKDLMDAGADSVRVGIGGGAACNTRFATGIGVPVLSSIMDVYNNIDHEDINGIVSDGAIKQTGDIVKALAAGASAVMMGSMFSGHDECEKNEFRGIASLSLQLDMLDKKPDNSSQLHIEGVHGNVDPKGSVSNTLNQMANNIKSGMSYCGASNLNVFKKTSRFIYVSSQSIQESAPRV